VSVRVRETSGRLSGAWQRVGLIEGRCKHFGVIAAGFRGVLQFAIVLTMHSPVWQIDRIEINGSWEQQRNASENGGDGDRDHSDAMPLQKSVERRQSAKPMEAGSSGGFSAAAWPNK